MAPLPRPLRILDIGGTNEFWEPCGWVANGDYDITILNQYGQERQHTNVHPVVGDATDLSRYETKSFDVAFSNSVIEHLFTFENQKAMASEIRRVATHYWVQTSNYWFPMEPHFHFFGWQWLPVSTRTALLRRRRCGWCGRIQDPVEARKAVEEVRLMTRQEIEEAFPDARIEKETLCGLVKSWIAVGGMASSGVSAGRAKKTFTTEDTEDTEEKKMR